MAGPQLFFNSSSNQPALNYSVVFGTVPSDNRTFPVVTRIQDGGSGSSDHPPVRLTGELRIALYSIIFLLSVIGNVLVIVTLVQHRRMRTVTNVFLLNLSISDLLLAVFCMPFTLIPTLLQNFIFGKAMCVLIRYMQGKDDYLFSVTF